MRTLTLFLALALVSISQACPFCNAEAGKTLLEEVGEARFVVYGWLESADESKETSVIGIEKVIKDDPDRPKGDRLTIKKFLDPNVIDRKKDRVLLFCDFYKGQPDAYRGVVVKTGSKMPEYIEGVRARKDKPLSERLAFCFNYLDDPDQEVSGDAYKEFARSDYSDFKAMAKSLPSARVLKWLTDKTSPAPAFRMGLYASMLGHCGKAEDADVVKKLLDDPDRRTSGVDGLLAAYVMLKPKEGFAYLRNVLKSPKEDFMYRYAALRALRFLNDYRSDLVARKELVEAACLLLDQDDISDMAVEDLRKWKAWETAPRVVALTKKPNIDELTVVKRAVLRYCIQAEGSPEAEAYLKARTADDPEAVKDARELLDIEKPAIPAKKPPSPRK
jgi:hypothetical protein